MDAQVPEDVKEARLAELQALLKTQQDSFNDATVGRTVPVLIERNGRHDGQMGGRTPYMQAVHLAAPASLLGAVVDVRILATKPNSLTGALAVPAARAS
jgi:tRNA-2-methylthio-N6-dimethylallyladenosine synthase